MIKLAIWEMEPVDSFIYLLFALKFSETFKNSANLNWILMYPRSLFPSFLRKICMLQPIGRTSFLGATQKLKMGEGHPWWSSG